MGRRASVLSGYASSCGNSSAQLPCAIGSCLPFLADPCAACIVFCLPRLCQHYGKRFLRTAFLDSPRCEEFFQFKTPSRTRKCRHPLIHIPPCSKCPYASKPPPSQQYRKTGSFLPIVRHGCSRKLRAKLYGKQVASAVEAARALYAPCPHILQNLPGSQCCPFTAPPAQSSGSQNRHQYLRFFRIPIHPLKAYRRTNFLKMWQCTARICQNRRNTAVLQRLDHRF